MNARPSGMFAHLYMLSFAVALGAAFGAAWSLIPLSLGFLLLMVAS